MSYSRHLVYISDDDDDSDHEEAHEETEVINNEQIEDEEEEEEGGEEQHQQQDEDQDEFLEEGEINNEPLQEEEEEEEGHEAEMISLQIPETSLEVDEVDKQRNRRRRRREEGQSSSTSKKRIRSKRKESNKNVEGGGVPYCSICMEPWYPEGDHQVSCLPCGHVYGSSCINKWIQCSRSGYSKCPQCNEKCRLKDIKTLYISGLTVAYCEQEKKLLSLQAENELLKMKVKEREEKKRKMWETKRLDDLRYKRLANKMKVQMNDMRILLGKQDKTYKRLGKEYRERMGRMTELLFGRETIYLD